MSAYVILLVAALILAAVAATAETSMTSVSRLRVRTLAEEGHKRAQRLQKLRQDPNGYLSTILTVNTVAVIVASTAAAFIGIDQFPHFPQGVITVVLSILVLVVCEIAPKTLALRFNERIALSLVGVVGAVTRALRPIVWTLTVVATLLVRPASRGGALPGPFVTEEDLKVLVAVGEQEGTVEQEEREMIHGVLDMTDKAVREIMVPRVDVVAMDATHHVGDIIQLVLEHGHSRIPVYEESVDNIVGVVYAKDLLRHGVRSDDTSSIKEIARDAHFTPETKKLGELLHEMQVRKVHISIVVDEYGGTAGIVTIEDLIEEIVGPIRDEYDTAEKEEVQFLSDHEVLMNARVPVDDVGALLRMDLGEVEADSIGGLVYERLGEIPKVGATVALGNAQLIVEAVHRQSIQSVRIVSPTPLIRGGSYPPSPLPPAELNGTGEAPKE